MEGAGCLRSPWRQILRRRYRHGEPGSVTSCDIHPHKLRLIEAGYQRLGLDIIHANLLDGKERKAELLNSFDLVIADVPCSGLGIIRKKPDIRYKDPKPLENLPCVQAAILDNVADYVRPGRRASLRHHHPAGAGE